MMHTRSYAAMASTSPERLVADHLNLVRKIAWHTHGRVGKRIEIEDLMQELAQDYTIIIVTHNMQQAQRASDITAFFMMGELIEERDAVKELGLI